MSQEILLVSSHNEANPSSVSFQPVIWTAGILPILVKRLEKISYARFKNAAQDVDAAAAGGCSHLVLTLGGEPRHVLSRIGFQPAGDGADGLDSSPKILARHIVLTEAELVEGGPAAALGDPGFCDCTWNGMRQTLTRGQLPQPQAAIVGKCHSWEHLTGDAGWSGVLAETVLNSSAPSVTVICPAGESALPLIVEAIGLLPARRQWQCTFTTHAARLPAEIACRWRFVSSGTPAAAAARCNPQTRVIDLEQLSGRAPGSELVDKARGGDTRAKSKQRIEPANDVDSTGSRPQHVAALPPMNLDAIQPVELGAIGSVKPLPVPPSPSVPATLPTDDRGTARTPTAATTETQTDIETVSSMSTVPQPRVRKRRVPSEAVEQPATAESSLPRPRGRFQLWHAALVAVGISSLCLFVMAPMVKETPPTVDTSKQLAESAIEDAILLPDDTSTFAVPPNTDPKQPRSTGSTPIPNGSAGDSLTVGPPNAPSPREPTPENGSRVDPAVSDAAVAQANSRATMTRALTDGILKNGQPQPSTDGSATAPQPNAPIPSKSTPDDGSGPTTPLTNPPQLAPKPDVPELVVEETDAKVFLAASAPLELQFAPSRPMAEDDQPVVVPGDTVLVLPITRATVALPDGGELILLGGTQVEFMPGGIQVDQSPIVRVNFGRLLLTGQGSDARECQVRFQFDDAQTSLGKFRYHTSEPPSVAAPENTPSDAGFHLAIEVLPDAFQTRMQENVWRADSEAVEWIGMPLPQETDWPEWSLPSSYDSSWNEPAAEVLRKELHAHLRSINPQTPQWHEQLIATLTEEALSQEIRGTNVSQMAASTLGYLGEFGPLVRRIRRAGIDSPLGRQLAANWEVPVRELHSVALRTPVYRGRVAETITRSANYNTWESQLLQDLLGTPGDDDQQFARLKSWIKSPDTILRVFAAWNLRRIKQTEDTPFNPYHKTEVRLRALRNWTKELQATENR